MVDESCIIIELPVLVLVVVVGDNDGLCILFDVCACVFPQPFLVPLDVVVQQERYRTTVSKRWTCIYIYIYIYIEREICRCCSLEILYRTLTSQSYLVVRSSDNNYSFNNNISPFFLHHVVVLFQVFWGVTSRGAVHAFESGVEC